MTGSPDSDALGRVLDAALSDLEQTLGVRLPPDALLLACPSAWRLPLDAPASDALTRRELRLALLAPQPSDVPRALPPEVVLEPLGARPARDLVLLCPLKSLSPGALPTILRAVRPRRLFYRDRFSWRAESLLRFVALTLPSLLLRRAGTRLFPRAPKIPAPPRPRDAQGPGSADAPRRVLLVGHSLGSGGAERQIVATLSGLTARPDLRATAIFRDLRSPGADFHLERAAATGAEIAELEGLLLRTHLPVGLERLADAVSALPGPVQEEILAYAAEFLRRRPHVVHVWQDMPHAALAALLIGTPRAVVSWRNLAANRFPYCQPFLRPLYRVLADRPEVVFTNNSLAGRDDYAQWLGLSPERITVLRNGLDALAWKPVDFAAAARYKAQLNVPADAPVVGSIFRFQPEKDPLLWIRVAGRIAARRPDVFFIVLGEGPQRAEMEQAARELGFADRLRLPGPAPAVQPMLGGLDLFLLTSLAEGTPNVLLEAQILGCPVITTVAGGSAECVDHGRTGLAIESRDPEVLAEAAIRALNDTDWRKSAALAGRPFVAERFGQGRMIRETLAAYGLTDPAAPQDRTHVQS